MAHLVHHDKSALIFASSIFDSLQEEVETVAQFFKCQLHRVARADARLIDGNGKQPMGGIVFTNSFKRSMDQGLTRCAGFDRLPRTISPSVHIRSVKFYVLRVA